MMYALQAIGVLHTFPGERASLANVFAAVGLSPAGECGRVAALVLSLSLTCPKIRCWL